MFGLTYLFVLFGSALCHPSIDVGYLNNTIVKDGAEPPTDDPIPPIDPTTAAEIIEDIQAIYLNEPIPASVVSRAGVIVDPAKIHFRLFNKNYPKRPLTVDDSNMNEVDPKLKAIFITHGWITYHQKLWIHEMKDAFLIANNSNVFVVDWDVYSFLPYALSVSAVPQIGKVIADFVMKLNQARNYSLSDFHLVGHSLGAQICGFAGQHIRKTQPQKIGRISGLDAAGPLFENPIIPTPDDSHLTYKDADFVDAIHTNGKLGGFGYRASYGDIDFFPNGGEDQRGCDIMAIPTNIDELIEKSDLVFCSHRRSVAYFTESISSRKFVSRECESYIKYELRLCKFAEKAIMGQHVDEEQQGNFYLKTNRHSPYARG